MKRDADVARCALSSCSEPYPTSDPSPSYNAHKGLNPGMKLCLVSVEMMSKRLRELLLWTVLDYEARVNATK